MTVHGGHLQTKYLQSQCGAWGTSCSRTLNPCPFAPWTASQTKEKRDLNQSCLPSANDALIGPCGLDQDGAPCTLHSLAPPKTEAQCNCKSHTLPLLPLPSSWLFFVHFRILRYPRRRYLCPNTFLTLPSRLSRKPWHAPLSFSPHVELWLTRPFFERDDECGWG